MTTTYEITRRKDVDIAFDDGASTGAKLVRVIDETKSPVMGGGYFHMHDCPSHSVLPYDEVAFCLEGVLKLTIDGVEHRLMPGDMAWLPKGTDVTFDGEHCLCGYGAQPVDWRNQA